MGKDNIQRIYKRRCSEIIRKIFRRRIVTNEGENRLIVDKEHIMPLNRITKKLLELPENPSIEEIESILLENVKYATITKEEDRLLSKQDMPSEYFDANHILFNDLFARYKSINIKLTKNNIESTL